jgi:Bacterial pre-peptidase C-terminal domain
MNRRVRTALALLTVGAALPFSPLTKLARAADADPAIAALPRVLDAKLTGSAAVDGLRAKGLLATVAANANISEAALTTALQSDPSATVDETGNLRWDDTKLPKAPAAAPAAPGAVAPRTFPGISMEPGSDAANTSPTPPTPATAAAPAVAEADPANYHSRPGASKVIYLDFDGHATLASSAWGVQNAPAFDLDGNPATYSSSEILAIRDIWSRVAEDYATFDVDVTTADPGFTAINRATPADNFFGTRVVVSTGGVADGAISGAFNESVNHAAQQPVWVLHNSVTTIKNVGESATHQVGHALGLLHDGQTGGSPTYAGESNWAPIMGNANTRPVSVWSKGEYPNANNLEDDIALIRAIIGPVPDESTSRSDAQQLGLIDTLRATRGVISGPGDDDYIRFVSPTAGTIKVTATGATKPNLDIGIVLLNGVGNGIAGDRPASGSTSDDIATGMDASITIDLPAPGVYYVYIYGDSTQVGATGYSQYGSGGEYRVAVETLTTSGDSYAPVTQQRLLDTRGGPLLTTGTSRNLTVAGVAGVPANATAVALNVAAVSPALTGHLRVYPAGPIPNASVLNFNLGKNTPNHVIVKVGTAGQIGIYASASTHVIVDIAGYFFDDDSLSQFVPVNNPTQIFEGGLAGVTAIDIQVQGVGGIPNNFLPDGIVQTVAVNIGAKQTQAAGHLRVWTTGEPMPNASTNNFIANETRMNLVLVRPDANGRISVFNASSAPLTITVYPVGVFRKSIGLGFKPTDPTRTLDTRAGLTPNVGPGNLVEAQIRGVGTVPNSTDVKAVVVNIVSTRSLAAGFASAGPSELNDPVLPTFYFPAGENVANVAILKVGANGRIRIVNNSLAATDFIVDIMGYLTD